MLPSWAKDTVTRMRATVKVVRGSEMPDWTTPDLLDITGCSVQPAGTSLSQDGRVLGIDDRFTCYMPPGSDVLAGDRIRWNDKVYAVIGEPQSWNSPTGRVSNMQVTLERWDG